MTPSAGDGKTAGELGPSGARALKIAIVVMGVMIVLGLLAIIGRIFYLAGKPARPAVPAAVSVPTAGAPLVPRIKAELPAGASVRTMALAGDRLAVHYDGPTGSGILVIDLGSGEIVSRVELGVK